VKKLSLSEWAAIGELVASIAVVVSLVFVAFSIRQNTGALQGTTENLVFEKHAELASLFVADASLAAILAKKRSGEGELSDVEQVRWEKYLLNLLDVWALAYHRHRESLLSDQQFENWDSYFSRIFCCEAERISRDRWEELRYGFDPEFWSHVGEALHEK
jgi:hypothetical protein